MSKGKDVKFIIYQVLYIFVVCVIALKGANLDLSEVLSKDKVVEKTYADSLKKYIDSILALGLVPRIEIDTTMKDLAELQRRLEQMKSAIVLAPGQVVVSQNYLEGYVKKEDIKVDEKNPEEVVKEPNVSPVVAQTLVQYRPNTVKNGGNMPLEIYADGSLVASIAPGSAQTFTLMGEKSVTFKSGGQSSTASTRENKLQVVTVQTLAPSGEEASIRQIQAVTAWRVTIDDDFPDQLEVKFSGPVSVNQKGNSYDVKLNLIGSKESYDRFTDSKDSPYSVSFTVSVTDKLSKKTVSRMGSVSFGNW
jgi:hypothetical protein